MIEQAPEPCTTPRPGVDKWFRIYMWVGFIFMIFFTVGFFAMPAFPLEDLPDMTEEDIFVFKFLGPVYGVFGIISLILIGVSLFTKPQPWTWIYNLVTICIGLMSCSLIFCIPLLIFWLKPECKHYYGRAA